MGRFDFLDHKLRNQRPYWLQFVFNGAAFETAHRFTIVNATTEFHQIKTGSKLVHIIDYFISWQGNNAGPLVLDVLEEPTITDGTTTPDVLSNLDRRSSKTSDFQYFTDPTSVSGGTLVQKQVSIGGETKEGQTTSPPQFELLLKPNTDYALRFTNETGANADTFFKLNFYESDN